MPFVLCLEALAYISSLLTLIVLLKGVSKLSNRADSYTVLVRTNDGSFFFRKLAGLGSGLRL